MAIDWWSVFWLPFLAAAAPGVLYCVGMLIWMGIEEWQWRRELAADRKRVHEENRRFFEQLEEDKHRFYEELAGEVARGMALAKEAAHGG